MQVHNELSKSDKMLYGKFSPISKIDPDKESFHEMLEHYKEWLGTIPAGIALYEWKGNGFRALYSNEEAARMFGYRLEEIHPIFVPKDSIYPEDYPAVTKKIQEGLQKEKVAECEFRINHVDGSHPWIHFRAERVQNFSGRDIIVAVLLDVTRNKNAEKEARDLASKFKYLSEHDELTGLYNRPAFYKKTTELLKANQGKAYVMIRWDAEHFKLVNEMSGYEKGNQILLKATELIAKFLQGKGVAGRFGADHFITCFPLDMLDMQSSHGRINEELKLMNLDCELKVYAGIYVIQDIFEPVDIMCDKATLALVSVKGKYQEFYAFYTTEMLNNMLKEQEVKNEMKAALTEEQFKIYIQPKFDLSTGKVIGGEALVRWIHPQKGEIYPGEFIPFFEKCGFVYNMDQYIWEHVVAYLKESFQAGKRVLPLSINVSRADFYRENLYEYFTKLMQSYSLPYKYLELEVTESAYSVNEDIIYDTLEQLQGDGFCILIDDFGSGYSSFNMMKEAPVDLLKLDMIFLQGIDKNGRGKTIVKHIVSLSKELSIPVIAEGVETQEQVDFLREIGCDFAQGYFYSKPVPLEEYDRMVQAEKGYT